MTLHLALWSGPNIVNGALLRSFANRSDTLATDAPFYGSYLAATGADHPDAAELVSTLETDWRRTVQGLDGPAPNGSAIWAQHHQPHHLPPEMDRAWLGGFKHVFLVQEPRAQLAWLLDKLGQVRLEDTGLPHLVEVYRWIRRTRGFAPLVITVEQLLASPAETLEMVCESLGIAYQESMVSWAPGPAKTDSPWAQEWHTTELGGFPPACGRCARGEAALPPAYEPLAARCAPLHAEIERHKAEILVH